MSFWSTLSLAQRTAACFCLHLLIIVLGVHFALVGLSAKSTLGVFCGMGLLAALGTGYANKILAAIRWAKRHIDGGNLFPLLLLVLFIGGCTRVEPGHVGIIVHLYGGAKGVDFEPVGVGMIWYNPMWTSVYEYPTYVQTGVWTVSSAEGKAINEEISFTCGGMLLTADISLSYHLEADKVPAFFAKFRTDDLNTFTHGFLRNVARDGFNEVAAPYSVDDCYISKKGEVIQAVRNKIASQVSAYGVTLEQFGYLSAPRPPQNVVEALNEKIKATQKAMQAWNEVESSKAEAQKVIERANGDAQAYLIRSTAEAEGNKLVAASVTENLIRWATTQRWDTHLPSVIGGNAGLLLQLPAPAAPQKVVP